VPSSKFGYKKTAGPPPPICKKPPKPPLAPIARPPLWLLVQARLHGIDISGGPWSIGGFTRCTRQPPSTVYHGLIKRGSVHLAIIISYAPIMSTLATLLDLQHHPTGVGSAETGPISIPPTGPITLDLDTWIFIEDATIAHAIISS